MDSLLFHFIHHFYIFWWIETLFWADFFVTFERTLVLEGLCLCMLWQALHFLHAFLTFCFGGMAWEEEGERVENSLL